MVEWTTKKDEEERWREDEVIEEVKGDRKRKPETTA